MPKVGVVVRKAYGGGHFAIQRAIAIEDAKNVKRVVFCSGSTAISNTSGFGSPAACWKSGIASS